MPTAYTPAEFERRIENTIPSEVFTTAPAYRRPPVITDANALISDSMRSTRGLADGGQALSCDFDRRLPSDSPRRSTRSGTEAGW